MNVWMTLVVAVMALSVGAEDASARHGGIDHGAGVGPNGVKERVAIRLNKAKTGADAASIQIDLGDQKYDSVKSTVLTKDRPTIIVALGSVATMTGLSNEKGVIEAPEFKAKLVSKGAGMKIDIKKGTLTNLLSDLSGKGEHATITLTIMDDHAPATTAAATAGRHAHTIFTKVFELEIKENDKSLIAKD